jgi:large subunit ribosomal protein L13e
MRKKWQFHVKTWFDQPAKAAKRSITRKMKARRDHPKPVNALRPVVRCPTNKYNTKARFGRGFSVAELKAAKIPQLQAKGFGIAVDFRRRNKSEEGFKVNVERLQQYKSKLVIFPSRKAKKDEFNTHTKAQFNNCKQVKNTNLVSSLPKPVAEEPRAPTAQEKAMSGKVVNMLRQALMNKKLYGRRVRKYNKQLANKALADKKASKAASKD